MKEKLSIIKIGGNIIENETELNKFLALFAAMDAPKILVHGGGKKANQILLKMGIEPQMAKGRRITDGASLEVAVMVFAGLVNKTLVAKLQALKCNAMGMSGADGNAITAQKRPIGDIDYGFAGDVISIKTNTISDIINIGLSPVFCALTHDDNGQLLNTNADTIASELAIGLSSQFETSLYYCFEMPGVLEDISDQKTLITTIDRTHYAQLVERGVISNGMLPKLHNCFEALKKGVKQVHIGNLALFEKENDNYTTLTL
ncbi:MAG: acetylglutamate kinase [Croceitalea sp.]|nr:acetylglutamate kinase [Croceitalea sp.]